ncbi:unnamed protein product [Paramecium primaurelia]|uniref:Uncharacterized protein n=1 Tax=Paramecium primaurelia TaxID=5886 RepID=A0A8S1Q323_PARPR|nr:unnamed protein product [Paramecium primaurelia]
MIQKIVQFIQGLLKTFQIIRNYTFLVMMQSNFFQTG